MPWWKVITVTERDGDQRTLELRFSHANAARALTECERVALADHGDGAVLKGAWCYFAEDDWPPRQGWKYGEAPRFGADENDMDSQVHGN
jgi:hypothetical protein